MHFWGGRSKRIELRGERKRERERGRGRTDSNLPRGLAARRLLLLKFLPARLDLG